jgi:hypothetical protein
MRFSGEILENRRKSASGDPDVRSPDAPETRVAAQLGFHNDIMDLLCEFHYGEF